MTTKNTSSLLTKPQKGSKAIRKYHEDTEHIYKSIVSGKNDFFSKFSVQDLCQLRLTNYQRNLLHIAVWYNQQHLVDSICENPAFQTLLNEADNNGDTPLHLAVFCQNFEAFKSLIHRGANYHIANQSGEYPLEMALEPTVWSSFLEKAQSFVSDPKAGRRTTGCESKTIERRKSDSPTIIISSHAELERKKLSDAEMKETEEVLKKKKSFGPKVTNIKISESFHGVPENSVSKDKYLKPGKTDNGEGWMENILEITNAPGFSERDYFSNPHKVKDPSRSDIRGSITSNQMIIERTQESEELTEEGDTILNENNRVPYSFTNMSGTRTNDAFLKASLGRKTQQNLTHLNVPQHSGVDSSFLTHDTNIVLSRTVLKSASGLDA